MLNNEDIKFHHPFCMTIAGPTQSGKTYFVYNLLKKQQSFISPEPSKILYCYSIWQPLFNKMLVEISKIEFIKGLPTESEKLNNCLIVIDDLMTECIDNKEIVHLFTVGSHHRDISVIFLTQNIYEKGKYARSISLNSHYFILFNNRRDKGQIQYLGRQLFPGDQNFFMEVYEDSISKEHGHLIIDLKPKTSEIIRLRTIDFKNNQIFVYNKK